MFAEWRRLTLPLAESPVILAVSGGADSTALLLAVHELIVARKLGVRVTVAHLDHALPGDEDFAEFVAELAADHGFEFTIERTDVRARAAATRDNLEQAARKSRYEFLGREARRRGARFVLVAHTLDDQAETVLLRLMRGSGADGLGGMLALRPLIEAAGEAGRETGASGREQIVVARPLLAWARRADTEDYCRLRGREFLRDWINDDERYARVRVRRDLLPLLRTFNPRIERTLVRTARLLRDDAAVLDEQARRLLVDAAVEETGETVVLDARAIAAAPAALQRRALRRWLLKNRGHLRRLEETHIEALLSLLAGERGGRVIELPGGGKVERRAGKIRFLN